MRSTGSTEDSFVVDTKKAINARRSQTERHLTSEHFLSEVLAIKGSIFSTLP